MSTRSMIHFNYGKEIAANVYVHYDGYPDGDNGMLAQLKRFFAAVKRNTKDRRFDHPEYLAAKFIVWYTQDGAEETLKVHPLEFLGIGPAMIDHEDVEYIYTLDCQKGNNEKPPHVSHTAA